MAAAEAATPRDGLGERIRKRKRGQQHGHYRAPLLLQARSQLAQLTDNQVGSNIIIT